MLTTGGSGTIPAWEAAPGSGSFSGPGSSTENAVVRFTNTSGNAGDNSGILIDDSNNVTGAGNVTLSGELDAATGDFSGIIDVAGVATLASLVCTAGGTFGGAYSGGSGATISTAGVGQFNGALTTDGALTAAALAVSASSGVGTISLEQTGNNGTSPEIKFVKNRGDGNAATGLAGAFSFQGLDAANNTDTYAQIRGSMDDVTSGGEDGSLQFWTNGGGTLAECMRIDNAGNVGIGTTAPGTDLEVRGPAGDFGHITISTAETTIVNTDPLGRIDFRAPLEGSGSNAILPTARITAQATETFDATHNQTDLLFMTANDGGVTEKMRITSAGYVGIGGTPTVPFHIFSAVAGDVVQWEQTNTSGSFLRFRYNGITPDNNTVHFLHGSDNTANRVYIYSDGDLANHDGIYGTISDVKLKQDIEDVRSYWDDFKQLQYRKFRHKTDVEVDADAPYRLGLVAQEVETIFPALVPESPDGDIETEEAVVDEDGEAVLDEEGNPTYETISTPSGTTHKWVKSSIVEGPIMGSVVQELQTRLEAAEAKITALESA